MTRLWILGSILGLLVSCKHVNKVEYEIPFIYDGFLKVKCTMNDTIHGVFAFDTGVYDFVLDSAFEREFIHNPGFYTLFGDHVLLSNFMRIKVDSLKFFPEFVSVYNCKKPFGKFMDGLIGWNLFRGKIVEIDYLNSKIKVYDPDKYSIEDGFEQIPLKFFHEKIFLNAELKLKEGPVIKGQFLLDLGYGGAIHHS